MLSLPRFLNKTKILLFFALCYLLFALSLRPIWAFSVPNESQFDFEHAVFGTQEMNLQSFVYETYKSIIYSTQSFLIGCLTCPTPGSSGVGDRGLIGGLAFLTTAIYAVPPASSIDYLADIGERLNLVAKPAYAQGIGFTKMQFILPIWKTFRNIAYVFFVLVFILTGFAIMFRVKLDAKTVVTIESAIPRMVMGIILVTFSYAIAGFLIDLMWVINNLIIVTFKNITPLNVTFGFPFPITEAIGAIWGVSLTGAITFTLGGIVFTSIGLLVALLGALASVIGVGAGLFIAIAGGLIPLIYLVVYAIAYLRVLWTLIKAYASVVLAIIFAPLQLMIGILPGVETTGSWFRNIIANLAVLPAVITMVLLSSYLTSDALIRLTGLKKLADAIPKGIPAVIQVIQDALKNLGSAPYALVEIMIMLFVGLGILLLAPKVSDMIQAFMAGKPFAYGTAIGEAMGPAKLIGTGALQYYASVQQEQRANVWAQRGVPPPPIPWIEALRRLGVIR